MKANEKVKRVQKLVRRVQRLVRRCKDNSKLDFWVPTTCEHKKFDHNILQVEPPHHVHSPNGIRRSRPGAQNFGEKRPNQPRR